MNYLRYSSDEMYSSTELIRKSKAIFDKLNKKKIEKAIILRDGKPGFMLLDFATYEKIMREFVKLKNKSEKNSSESYLSLDDIEVSTQENSEKLLTPILDEIPKINETINEEMPADDVDELTSDLAKLTSLSITSEEDEVNSLDDRDTHLDEITQIDQMSSSEIDDEELEKALAEIEKINIPDAIPENEKIEFDDEMEINLESIEEEKIAQPLKEFWDK